MTWRPAPAGRSPGSRLEIHVPTDTAYGPDRGRAEAGASLRAALPAESVRHVTELAVVAVSWESLATSVAEDALTAAPAIRTLTAVTAGAVPQQISGLVRLHRSCGGRGVRFSTDFVLDAGADACAALARRATSLRTVLDATRALRLHGAAVRWRVPVIHGLAYRLEAIFSLAEDEGAEPMLVSPALAGAPFLDRPDPIDEDERRFVQDFVAYRLLADENGAALDAQAQAYRALADILPGRTPGAGAPDVRTTVLQLGENGWSPRERLPAAAQVSGSTGEAGASAALSVPAQPKPSASEVAAVLAEGLRAVGAWARSGVWRRPHRTPAAPATLPRVLVVGAYGGDHIGDAAILGGVLLRMSRRHGTREAILVSQRPDHTRRLVAMLDSPVAVTVEPYEQSTAAQLVDRVDGVVFGGGPLMDLPKQLVKHLYTVSLARGGGKPFIVEGIGAGPFVRRLSFWTARRLVLMADGIVVRTADDRQAPLLRGLTAGVNRDPAFDYLETRGRELTRLPEVDRHWLERLLQDTGGRVTVGLNLRPIRADFTVGASAGSRVAYTRFIEARFEERLAEAMRKLHAAITPAPCFIFFPMNAIQFGSSDLRSAYRVQRLLRGDVDFRIWEHDPGIDGVVALLRRLDIAITMRFHATIFALAQGTRVVGVDYRPGRRDKVAALLSQFGLDENCRRVDEMTTGWLYERLLALARETRSVEADGLKSDGSRDCHAEPIAGAVPARREVGCP